MTDVDPPEVLARLQDQTLIDMKGIATLLGLAEQSVRKMRSDAGATRRAAQPPTAHTLPPEEQLSQFMFLVADPQLLVGGTVEDVSTVIDEHDGIERTFLTLRLPDGSTVQGQQSPAPPRWRRGRLREWARHTQRLARDALSLSRRPEGRPEGSRNTAPPGDAKPPQHGKKRRKKSGGPSTEVTFRPAG